VKGLSAAISLLTIVPVPRVMPAGLKLSVAWFPLVGVFIGSTLAVLHIGLLVVLPSLAAAAVTVTSGILLTGALHEDGLADTADGWAGSTAPEEVMRIMRDPRTGTYGALAVSLSVVLRVAAVSELHGFGVWAGLVTAHALGRGTAAGIMGAFAPASHGLGAAHRGTRWACVYGIVGATAIGVTVLGLWGIVFGIVAGVVTVAMGRMARQRVGGYTGDILGATEQIVEVSLLLLAAGLVAGNQLQTWWLL